VDAVFVLCLGWWTVVEHIMQLHTFVATSRHCLSCGYTLLCNSGSIFVLHLFARSFALLRCCCCFSYGVPLHFFFTYCSISGGSDQIVAHGHLAKRRGMKETAPGAALNAQSDCTWHKRSCCCAHKHRRRCCDGVSAGRRAAGMIFFFSLTRRALSLSTSWRGRHRDVTRHPSAARAGA